MEDLLMGIDSRFKVLMADSTIMCILHTAMNKAHEKVRSKQGVIERLNEQSKFCELAIMQLEACLKFVQEETSNYILDNTYDKLLSDLTEIKNRLYGRLRETEIALADKDKELVEKDRALATKEKELQALRRYKDERKEENFCELKNSVDQQFWSIKQHLEGERMALTKRISPRSSISIPLEDSEILDVARDHSSNETDQSDLSPNKMAFDQMGFEIDRLKETLDAAFGIMQSTISDVYTLEVQWMRMIENDIRSILVIDFIMTLKEKLIFHPKQWSQLFNDVTLLRIELEQLVNSREINSKRLDLQDKSWKSMVKDEELEKLVHEDLEDGHHLIDKIIRNKESITRSKSEELKRVSALEMVHGNWNCKDASSLHYRIDNVVKRLDDFLKWKSRLSMMPNKECVKFDKAEKWITMVDLQCVANPEKKMICSLENGDDENKSKLIKLEMEDSRCRFEITKETYDSLYKILRNEFEIELHEYGIRNSSQEGTCTNMMNQIVKELKKHIKKKEMEYNNVLQDFEMMFHLNEGVLRFVLKEIMGDIKIRSTSSIFLTNKDETNSIQNMSKIAPLFFELDSHLRSHLQEEVQLLFFKEMANSWTHEVDIYKFEGSIRFEVLKSTFLETVKNYQEVIEIYETHLKDKSSNTKTNINIEVNDNENLVEKLDSPLRDINIEDLSKQSSETKEESMCMDLVGLDFKKTHMFTSNKVSSKLENVVQQLGSTKPLLKEIGYDEVINSSKDGVYDDGNLASMQDHLSNSLNLQKIGDHRKCNPPNPTLFCDVHDSFNQVFNELQENFEDKMQHKLNPYNSRLQKMSDYVKTMIKQCAIYKKKELLYKKAFIIRCQNLQKAESEVDVLGDQVDSLTGLLKKIYKTLEYYSPVLQHFSGVLDILVWIRNELNLGVPTHTPKHGF